MNSPLANPACGLSRANQRPKSWQRWWQFSWRANRPRARQHDLGRVGQRRHIACGVCCHMDPVLGAPAPSPVDLRRSDTYFRRSDIVSTPSERVGDDALRPYAAAARNPPVAGLTCSHETRRSAERVIASTPCPQSAYVLGVTPRSPAIGHEVWAHTSARLEAM
jgi:hypothetical protein